MFPEEIGVRGLSRICDGLVGQPMFKLLSRINAMERNGQKVIHLEIGDPYFNTPAHVIQATKEAILLKRLDLATQRG